MTREEQWQDPEIQALLMDVKASIDTYLHKKNKSPLVASLSAETECKASSQPGKQREVFTDSPQEANSEAFRESA